MIDFSNLIETSDKDKEPSPDLAICQECDWAGKVSECDEDYESDGWESSHYLTHNCPECDGGIEYDISEERYLKWKEWSKKEKSNAKD